MPQRTELDRPGANAPRKNPIPKAEIAAFLAEARAHTPRARARKAA
jgi:hypothetical protein